MKWYVTRREVNFPEELEEGNVVGQGSTKALAIEDAMVRLGVDDILSYFVQQVTGIDPVSEDAMFFTSSRRTR